MEILFKKINIFLNICITLLIVPCLSLECKGQEVKYAFAFTLDNKDLIYGFNGLVITDNNWYLGHCRPLRNVSSDALPWSGYGCHINMEGSLSHKTDNTLTLISQSSDSIEIELMSGQMIKRNSDNIDIVRERYINYQGDTVYNYHIKPELTEHEINGADEIIKLRFPFYTKDPEFGKIYVDAEIFAPIFNFFIACNLLNNNDSIIKLRLSDCLKCINIVSKRNKYQLSYKYNNLTFFVKPLLPLIVNYKFVNAIDQVFLLKSLKTKIPDGRIIINTLTDGDVLVDDK